VTLTHSDTIAGWIATDQRYENEVGMCCGRLSRGLKHAPGTRLAGLADAERHIRVAAGEGGKGNLLAKITSAGEHRQRADLACHGLVAGNNPCAREQWIEPTYELGFERSSRVARQAGGIVLRRERSSARRTDLAEAGMGDGTTMRSELT
jgi:hypothetical protein